MRERRLAAVAGEEQMMVGAVEEQSSGRVGEDVVRGVDAGVVGVGGRGN